MYKFEVPKNSTRLTFTTSGGSGNVDLSVIRDLTQDVAVCESKGPGTDETCFINAPEAGAWYLEVESFFSQDVIVSAVVSRR